MRYVQNVKVLLVPHIHALRPGLGGVILVRILTCFAQDLFGVICS